jgi:IclR family transcriptional regulator, KDG regulon repressor
VPEAVAAPYRLQSLNHALDVLEALESRGAPVGVTELAHNMGMSKGAVHRILLNLVARGYVQQSGPGGRYQLGLRTWELGTSVTRHMSLRDVSGPHLEKLAQRFGETAHLAIYDAGDVIYLNKVTSSHAVQAYSRIGGRAPAVAVATGKILLAHQPVEELDTIVGKGLQRYTEHTITSEAALRREVQVARERGYAVNVGEWRIDVTGVAAPVRDVTGAVVAALNISGPAYRLTADVLHDMASGLSEVAADVSRALGYENGRAATS